MAQLIIRKLDDAVKERLRERARRNGRSLEAEARAVLEEAGAAGQPQASASDEKGFGALMSELFGSTGLTPKERRKFDRAVRELNNRGEMRFPDFED